MNDPYSVLGVSRDASDAEIKSAYRRLAKRYHPDHNPGDAAAARKMNEINAAYDAIKNADTQNQYGFGAGQSGQYGGYYNPWQNAWGGAAGAGQNERTEIRAAENYIMNRHFREALTALASVEESGRNARWHYLSSLANMGLGNKIAAMESARRAVNMEPANAEYRQLLDQLEHGGHMYDHFRAGYPRVTIMGPDRLCMSLCAAQFCARLFCGC